MALTVSPTSKAFGSVAALSSSSPQTFTLTADVTSDSIFKVIITGANADQFSVSETFDTPAGGIGQYSQFGNSTIIAGSGTTAGTATFTGTFSPLTSGAKVGVIEVHYNGVGGAAVLSIAVTGTGT